MNSIVKALFTFCVFKIGQSGIVQFFEHRQFGGEKYEVNLNYDNVECINFPFDWMRRISSANTSGLCINLYDQRNCDGKEINLYPGTDHQNLENWEFDNLANSVKICDEDITYLSTKSNSIRISNTSGDVRLMNIQHCENVPFKLRHTIQKVETFGACFTFYTKKRNCKGEYVQIGNHTNPDIYSHQEPRLKSVYSIGLCKRDRDPLNGRALLPNVETSTENISTPAITTADLPTPKIPTTEFPKSNPNVRRDDEIGILGMPTGIFIAGIIFIIILLFIVMATFLLFRRTKLAYYKRVTELELQNENIIQQFINGNPKAFELIPYAEADATYRAQNMPYDADKYEVPAQNLMMDWKRALGTGEFGIVLRATVSGPKFDKPFQAAVKTVKPGADSAYVKALLDECKIMMYLKTDEHDHVVNFIGACTENLHELELYIIIEYCTNGSLQNFLRGKRNTFTNLIEHELLIQMTDVLSENNVINTKHLVKWSKEIADGMHYLSSKKVVHADLATRNVLLDGDLSVKISDFGLSRQLYQYSQYVKRQQSPLPWRWMAIECLEDMTFSTESDVWAFGVTLWEIFTLAQTPYPGLTWTLEWMENLKGGERLSKPVYASQGIYDLMRNCWQKLPEDRPTFEHIRDHFSGTLLLFE